MKSRWIKFNAGQSGFYRVAYSPLMSERLGKAILNGELSAADRLGIRMHPSDRILVHVSHVEIESDAFALARAGHISLVQALQVAQNFVHEDDYTVWSDLSQNLGDVRAPYSSLWSYGGVGGHAATGHGCVRLLQQVHSRTLQRDWCAL